MSAQLDIDFSKRARRSDPETSHAAARAAGAFAHGHYALILGALAEGPKTIYEIAARTGLDHVQVARRMSELQSNPPRVVRTGTTRPGPTGHKCAVWRPR